MWEKNPKIREITKEISLLTFKDERVVQKIAYSPLLFLKRIMENINDNKPIRIRYFGVFYQKHKVNKGEMIKNRFNKIIDNIEDVYSACKEDYPEFESPSEFENIVRLIHKEENWESLNLIYSKYKRWKK